METRHVLLVEDDQDFLEALRATFERHGFQVSMAVDGEEGLYKAIKFVPDIITLDVMLPKKDGYWVCHDLKKNVSTSKIPIIMLTSLGKQADDKTGADILAKGHKADAYFEKPIEPGVLVEKAIELIENAGEVPEEPSKVLLIDDDPDFIAAVKIMLEENRYKTVVAYTGEEGLLKVHKENPDIILLDVMLPDKDGFAVCKELKENEETRSIPVIMLTSISEKLTEPDYAKAMAVTHKADDYVEKPIASNDLLKHIRKLIGPMSRLV